MNIRKTWLNAAVLATTATVLAACGGGSSDVAGEGDQGGGAETTLTLVAYAVPEPGWSKIIPAFAATEEGKGVAVTTSYGASGDQSRAVVDGKPADIVNFSVEPDVARLVKADKVAKDWNADATKGIPFGSVVSLVVRKGNPKNIKDWDDLLKPGVEVVTPSPLSSGSAKWNLLAPYAAKSDGGKNQQAGLDFVTKLVTEHVKTRPGSGREATDVFLQGTGDVLISYENEAINIERQGKPVRAHQPAADVQDREPGRGGHVQRPPRPGQRAEELPVHPRGPEDLGAGGLPARRPVGRRGLRDRLPDAAEAVDHRGPRWMERGRSGVVRQGERHHHQDLQAGDWMTAALDHPQATRPELTGDGAGRAVRGFFERRYGSTQPAGRGRDDWLSASSSCCRWPRSCGSRPAVVGRRSGARSRRSAAIESFKVTLTISIRS